jgi:hypothetical protein
VADFLETISPAFDVNYLSNFGRNCQYFDHIVSPSLSNSTIPVQSHSDTFIHDLRFHELTSEICQAISLRSFQIVSPNIKSFNPIHQYDGTPEIPRPEPGVVEDEYFTQITLVGPRNGPAFTRRLENDVLQSIGLPNNQPECTFTTAQQLT